MAVDWSRGYSCAWRVFVVDPATWSDREAVGGVTSLSVERSRDGDAPLLESASLSLDAPPGTAVAEGYWRVAMTATQDGASERVDVCTVLVSGARGSVSRGVDALDVTGRSVLWPAKVAVLPPGSYCPKGTDGPAFVGAMLREVLDAPVVVRGSVTVDEHVVFDDGTTVLEAAWLVLRACGYGMRILGDGTVEVAPVPDGPALSLDRASARLLHPEVEHELDWSEVPNRYVAIDGDEVAVAVNDDPSSPTSTVSRGWRHDVVDDHPVRVGGETLGAYAARRLAEESVATDSRSYSREWWPGVLPGDLVRGTLADVGLDGDLRVERQSLDCGRGIVVDEEARREVALWRQT